MAIKFHTDVMANGLSDIVSNATTVFMCSALPTTYAEASSGFKLGSSTITFNAPVAAVAGGGRKITSNPITTGTITGSGTVSHYGVCDATRLLAAGDIDASEVVTSGHVFSLGALSLVLPYEAAAAALLLDAYPNAAFALGLTKLRSAYSGAACNIRFTGDGYTADYGFVGNEFNASAVAADLATHGGVAKIVYWYDQSTNGAHFYEPTSGGDLYQPEYQPAGTGGKPSLSFSGDVNRRRLHQDAFSGFGSTSQGTLLSVCLPYGSVVAIRFLAWGSGTNAFTVWNPFVDGNIYFDLGNDTTGRTSVAMPSGYMSASHILECYRDSGGTQGITVDGVSLITAAKTAAITAASAGFEISDLATSPFIGELSALIWWNTDLGSTGRAGAREMLRSRYSVY